MQRHPRQRIHRSHRRAKRSLVHRKQRPFTQSLDYPVPSIQNIPLFIWRITSRGRAPRLRLLQLHSPHLGLDHWKIQIHSPRTHSKNLQCRIRHVPNQACSGSMDSVWSVLTGEHVFVLMGHTSLVGLLGLSPLCRCYACRIWILDSWCILRVQ